MPEQPVSVEQIARDLLSLAIREGLVAEPGRYADPDPQCRTSGELAAVANYLERVIGGPPPEPRSEFIATT